jgi:hypothetical protein
MGWLVRDRLPDKKRQQLIDNAAPALLPGERILDATGGMVHVHRFSGEHGRRGTLAVTDQRVFLQTKRVGGDDVQDFAYGLLSGCNYFAGARLGTIELVMAAERTRVTHVLKEDAKRIGPLIRHQIALARTSSRPDAAPQARAGPAGQLRKLAALRAAGLLTDQEYQAKRTEIIGML